MAILYVTEYSSLSTNQSAPIPVEPSNGDQNPAFGAQSSAFKNNTRFVRLNADGVCSVAFGTNPTATTNNRRLGSGVSEIFEIPVGQSYKVSSIANT